MGKKILNWVRCRLCGIAHNNPMSASLCDKCGVIEGKKNAIKREKERVDDNIFTETCGHAAELAILRAENERFREALNEIVSVPSAGGWVPSLQHCVDVAKEALK